MNGKTPRNVAPKEAIAAVVVVILILGGLVHLGRPRNISLLSRTNTPKSYTSTSVVVTHTPQQRLSPSTTGTEPRVTNTPTPTPSEDAFSTPAKPVGGTPLPTTPPTQSRTPVSTPRPAPITPIPTATPTLTSTGVRVYTGTIVIPSHVYTPFLTSVSTSTYNIPYDRLDWERYDPQPLVDRTFTVIHLENEYLELTILPQLGGRIYQAVFKPTGDNLFYQNPVLKPTHWGPPEMGWWLAAGGMEWCLPVEEHGYEWGVAWQYEIQPVTDPAGGVSGVRLWVRDTQSDDRLRVSIDITLFQDEAAFRVSPRIENPTGEPVDYKFWLNAMLAPGPTNAPGENLRFILPAGEVTVHSTGDDRLPDAGESVRWPVDEDEGVDWSRLGNWRQWFGFFQRPQARGDFQAVYDEDYDEGIVRTYDSRVAFGAKFFAFGWGDDALPPDLYTDDESGYVELHGGVAPTFSDTRRLAAGADVTWEEVWYPVAGLGGLSWANRDVALHVETQASQKRVCLVTVRPWDGLRVVLTDLAGQTILSDEDSLQVGPQKPYCSPWSDVSSDGGADGIGVSVYAGQDLLAAYP